MTTSTHLFGSNAPLGQIQHAARSRSSTVQCVKHPRRAGRSHINPPTPPPEGNARLRSANSRDCEILQNCCWIFPLANYGGGAVRCVQRSRTKKLSTRRARGKRSLQVFAKGRSHSKKTQNKTHIVTLRWQLARNAGKLHMKCGHRHTIESVSMLAFAVLMLGRPAKHNYYQANPDVR